MIISIITVAFNAEKTIKKTLDSVRKIKDETIEYIIIDGNSTDCTCKILEENQDIIDYYISEKDNGIYDAINKGIKAAHGEYTLFLAADDLIIPDAINEFLKSVKSDTDVWSGSIIYHNQYGYFVEESEEDLDRLKRECSLRHPATFFKREAFEKYGYYDSSFKCSGDREIFLRYYLKGAKFQVEKIPVEIFNVGGISTSNPMELPVKEGIIIEKKYGLYNSDFDKTNKKNEQRYKIKVSWLGRTISKLYYSKIGYKVISKVLHKPQNRISEQQIKLIMKME